MWELSGKVKENANGKYSGGYCFFWICHNAMLAFLKSWQRHTRSRIPGDIGDMEVLTKIYKYKKPMLIS